MQKNFIFSSGPIQARQNGAVTLFHIFKLKLIGFPTV